MTEAGAPGRAGLARRVEPETETGARPSANLGEKRGDEARRGVAAGDPSTVRTLGKGGAMGGTDV